jgi:glutathione S-transferase
MQLFIGNKNYSSWSLRSWLLMTQAGIRFDEVPLRLDFGDGSAFRTALLAHAPVAKVPLLVDDGGSAVWDSMAIAETLAERHPQLGLWPADAKARARARSICAEMHGGFGALRNACPMNIEAALPEVGARLLRDDPAVAADLARIDAMWVEALAASGGPFLFGAFGIADATYAPVASRTRTYGLPLSPAAAAYAERIHALPAMRTWTAAACAEHDFLPFDEPYRSQA